MLGFNWIKRILEKSRAKPPARSTSSPPASSSGCRRSDFIDFMIKLNGSLDRSRLNKLSDEELLEQAKVAVPGMSRLIALLADNHIKVDIPSLLAVHNFEQTLEYLQKLPEDFLKPGGGLKVRSSAPYSQGSSDRAMLSSSPRRW